MEHDERNLNAAEFLDSKMKFSFRFTFYCNIKKIKY